MGARRCQGCTGTNRARSARTKISTSIRESTVVVVSTWYNKVVDHVRKRTDRLHIPVHIITVLTFPDRRVYAKMF